MRKLSLDSEVQPPQDELVFHGATIVSCDPAFPEAMLDSAIAVKRGEIQGLGTSKMMKDQFPDALSVDASGWIIMPGMINAHTHCPMGFFRGLGHGKENMVETFMFPAEKALTPELVEPLCYSYIYGGLRSGVTCFGDHYYFSEGVAKALERFGLRGIVGETVADRGGAFPDKTRWDAAKQLIEDWPFSTRIRPAIAPHATDTISSNLLSELIAYAKQHHLPLHMHVSQTRHEKERVQKEFGKSPVAHLAGLGGLGPNSLAVHLTSATEEDFKILADHGATAGYCPASQIIFDRLASIEFMTKYGVKIALGTDCAASNDQSDLLSEVRLAGLLARDRGIKLDQVSPKTLLSWVTSQPAAVFGVSDVIGSLNVGKAADLVFLKQDLDSLPCTEVLTNLLYSMSAKHVRHVMVDGVWRLWNDQLVGANVEDLREAYLEAVGVIKSRVGFN